MWCKNIFLQSIKCIFAQLNIFLWKMYALQKCICNILCYKMYASNAFWHQMHFGIKCILASNAFWHQMHFCTAKMHFGIKCIFASNAFLLHIQHASCLCWTFSKGKCSVLCFLQSKKHSIFPLSRCPYILLVLTFSFGKCDAKMHFCKANQNVRKPVPLHFACFAKMHFCITFSFGKCDAKMHFCKAKQNVRKRAAQKTPNTAFLHQAQLLNIWLW